MNYFPVYLVIIYLLISFSGSVIEKVLHWNESKGFYRGHFKDTFLKNYIPESLLLVIVCEVISIGFGLSGLVALLLYGNTELALIGLVSVSFTLILLMTGQRIAQDYSGAMNITVYFILTVLGVFFLETY
jgi:putative oxidoreductase